MAKEAGQASLMETSRRMGGTTDAVADEAGDTGGLCLGAKVITSNYKATDVRAGLSLNGAASPSGVCGGINDVSSFGISRSTVRPDGFLDRPAVRWPGSMA